GIGGVGPQSVSRGSARCGAGAALGRHCRALPARSSRSHGGGAGAPRGAWPRKVFPEAAPDVALARLWDAIAALCRLDHPDPTAAWRAHLAALDARKDHLNARRYSALLYTGPDTNLTIGLPDRHVWVTGQSTSSNGILFAANLPTEE